MTRRAGQKTDKIRAGCWPKFRPVTGDFAIGRVPRPLTIPKGIYRRSPWSTILLCRDLRAARIMYSGLQNRLDRGPLTTTCSLADYPFYLGRQEAYRRWRDTKLEMRALPGACEPVEITKPESLRESEKDELISRCRQRNYCLYAFPTKSGGEPGDAVITFGRQLGLRRIDHPPGTHPVATISVDRKAVAHEYIPYTNRAINWHTDGYYNSASAQVRGIIMHCVRPATEGGANTLLDPELVYIKLRDLDPDLVGVLMNRDVMRIPANVKDEMVLRPARSGPVFSMDYYSGRLHMRYTHRTRSIDWSASQVFPPAGEVLRDVIEGSLGDASTVRLTAGQGIVCNNVLHTRTAFDDTHPRHRTLLRARYHERIAGT